MGIPILGSGRVFTVPEEVLSCQAFEIPRHWPQLGGIDFGWDHVNACVWAAWDRDSDCLYLTHAYGQRDPLVAYRAEGQQMFKDLLARMQHDVVHALFRVTVNQQPANGRGRQTATKASPMAAVAGGRRDAVTTGAGKIGRNAPCPCGSGKKYKRCCGANV